MKEHGFSHDHKEVMNIFTSFLSEVSRHLVMTEKITKKSNCLGVLSKQTCAQIHSTTRVLESNNKLPVEAGVESQCTMGHLAQQDQGFGPETQNYARFLSWCLP